MSCKLPEVHVRAYRVPGGTQFVVPSAARTANGNSGQFSGWHTAAIGYAAATAQSRLTISAASGTTPNLVVLVEDSPDGVAWTTRDTYPGQTGVATVTRALPNLAAFQRVSWTITGTTPSFTFSVQFAATTAQLT